VKLNEEAESKMRVKLKSKGGNENNGSLLGMTYFTGKVRQTKGSLFEKTLSLQK